MDEVVPARGPQTRSGPVTTGVDTELRQPLEMAARARSEPQGRSKWLLEPASEPQWTHLLGHTCLDTLAWTHLLGRTQGAGASTYMQGFFIYTAKDMKSIPA
jgi:hypothetical protein